MLFVAIKVSNDYSIIYFAVRCSDLRCKGRFFSAIAKSRSVIAKRISYIDTR